MIGYKFYPSYKTERKDALERRNGRCKYSIHLICVIVMQLLQQTQGLVTDNLSGNHVAGNSAFINITVMSATTRSLLLEDGASIMHAVEDLHMPRYPLESEVSPSAVVVNSLVLPQVSCTPFVSCEVENPGSCCSNIPKELNTNDPFTKTSTGARENSLQTLEEAKCESKEIFLRADIELKPRSKREADAAKNSPITARNRFRRPTTVKTTTEQEEEPEEVTQPALRGRKTGNFHTTANKPTVSSKKRLIKPSRASTSPSSRAKFTLREETTTQKSSTSSRRAPFRRPQISSGSGNKRVTTPSKINSSIGNRRINTHEESHTRSSLGNRGRSTTSSGRSRGGNLRDSDTRSRHRGSQDFNNEPVIDLDDGTITVTHLTPSETQIPVVNGQLTEYKQIVVAKTSTEVLGPHQYSTSFNGNGQTVLVLNSQGTSVNPAGATEITQYVLHGSPTTSVTFTPTTIRGRRTSFSYVLPSTAYSVENVVSTIQPQISADAPLANILLSQLLLGNVGFPSNPLFGAGDNNLNLNGNFNGNNVAATPTTEFRTHTSTYVTTVFEGTSTILPITFQGKKITTTIYDTTPKVITATEFVTDTIVHPGVAQTQTPQQSPINNLLLQQLLLQQVAQNKEQHQQAPQIMPTTQQAFAIENTKLPDYDNENHLRDSGHNRLLPSSNTFNRDDIPEVTTPKPRRNGKKHKKRNKDEAKSGESSVVTLYVSGKFPGEFSTVLSTVHIRPDATRRRRDATEEVQFDDFEDNEALDEMPRGLANESVGESKQEATQSLTEILGENHKWQLEIKPTQVY